MAALLQRGGLYYAQFYDQDRKPKRKRFSLKTKRKRTARRLLAEFEDGYLLGRFDPWADDPEAFLRPNGASESESLSEAFERFIESRREMNVTENTLRTYEETMRGLLRHASSSTPLKQLSASQVRSYIFSTGVAARTRQKRYTHVRAFLNYCTQQELLRENPLGKVAKPKADEKLPVATTQEDLEAVGKKMKAHYRKYRKTGEMECGAFLWRLSAFWLSYLTGLRRAELCRLRWEDVCLKQRAIRLRQQKSRREEILPISKKAAVLLHRMKKADPNPNGKQFVVKSPGFAATERNQRSFGNNLSRTWRTYRREAGLSEEKDFHSLRKGFVSELIRSGASGAVAQAAARHKSYETTRRYIDMHGTDSIVRDALDNAF